MTNPSSRTERDEVPISIYDEPEAVTVATGSYGLGHGLSITLNYHKFAEDPDDVIEEDAAVLLEEALERVRNEVDSEIYDEGDNE